MSARDAKKRWLNARTTGIYLDGRVVLRLITKPKPSFGYFSTVI